MASNTNYAQTYEQAEQAYLQRDFERAAQVIDQMIDDFPEDPRVILLRGQIYGYGFQDYQLAQQHYQKVLNLTDEPDLIDFAQNGIEQLVQLQLQAESNSHHQTAESDNTDDYEHYNGSASTIAIEPTDQGLELVLPDEFEADDNLELDFEALESDSSHLSIDDESGEVISDDDWIESELEFDEVQPDAPLSEPEDNDLYIDQIDDFDAEIDTREDQQNPFSEIEELETEIPSSDLANPFDIDQEASEINWQNSDRTMVITSDELAQADGSNGSNTPEWIEETQLMAANTDFNQEALAPSNRETPQREEENYNFEEIDHEIFELDDLDQDLPDTILFNSESESETSEAEASGSSLVVDPETEPLIVSEKTDINESVDPSGWLDESVVETQSNGPLGFFKNATIGKKQLLTAIATGAISAVAVGIVGLAIGENNEGGEVGKTGLMALVAGVAGFGTTWALGRITAKQIKIATEDLQTQFESVYQGNLNAQAKVYTQDELGHLAHQFNRMAQVILTTTGEAQRRAEETEQAKEDLQRQVIRLLDDVEGAARGDLTVQATVTADVLGAVADAFNLTIQSLKEIVAQVKQAAEDVNKGSRDSEKYARDQSSDALRMAEELAVTLNSVQMMTESIQRVAENAREAEEVARSASLTAVKGGQAVERTVSGIGEIRDTVSETARKVKRLAEASQEISKIVLLISGVAERTNQLALNASIQAAKAGEAGRGFAVVADEVRQLADRSGKALREIEQIVLQIQSETGSVMTAMEEGIQEVIDVTDRAEQAKKALDDIIQVSNHIDNLVSSITADTVKQRENSLAVAQVMQSVEMTAQGTSQESQRVAGSLSNLVDISQNLLASVEKFRIDA